MSSSRGSHGPSEHERKFIAYLEGLVPQEGRKEGRNGDRGALASLRRGLGKQPGEAAEMLPYVMPWAGSEDWGQQGDYFLVASLFAMHPKNWLAEQAEGKRPESTNLGASFHKLRAEAERKAKSGESINKRFVALLNSEREDLPDHLRHAISLFRAHDVAVDWGQLLHDLRWWNGEWRNGERRGVQWEWARAFWREAPKEEQAANDR
jgi:CRISPR system Cascade subunit CasB